MIYLRFITEKYSLESFLIRIGTRSPFSHVEFVRCAGFKDVPIDTFGARVSGGVKVRPYDYCKPSKEMWFTAPNIQHAYEWALTQVGKPYDWRAILGFAFSRDWREEDSWFCSELVCRAFEKTPIPLLNLSVGVWRISPRDLTLSNYVVRYKTVV